MDGRILAIIPARGGSKGIPRKNLRVLHGKPLVAHSVVHALRSRWVDRVVVSTDDDGIERVAHEYGAEVVRRPRELADDRATSESALLHVLDHLKAREGYEPDLVVFLQATSPLRPADVIDRAIDTLIKEDADSLFSACPLNGFVWRMGSEEPSSLSYDYQHRPRRQEAAVDVIENGSIYVFKPWVLRRYGNRLGGRIAVHIMDPLYSFQIDEPEDLERFERLFPALERCEGQPRELAAIRLLVLDFDGVMTDNRVLVDETGREAVFCSRADGLGLEKLKLRGIEVVVLSKEKNAVVSARCEKLGIPCVQALDDKLAALKKVVGEMGLSRDQVAFVGNDVNDLGCLGWCGVGIAVSDAEDSVRQVADWVTSHAGGRGAVREVCDALIGSQMDGGENRGE